MTVALRRAWARDLDAPTLYSLLALRVEVFVVEQSCPYPELDGRDLETRTRLRLLEDHGGGETAFRIGRVCTTVTERGRGHTARLMRAALDEVGESPCRISAQTYLADMYARHGFAVAGAEFDEDGIPHVPMLRDAHR